MAGTDRTATRALELCRRIQAKPYRYDFFQALRRLECAYREKPRIGHSKRSVDDPVRFEQEPSLACAARTIASVEPGAGGLPPRLSVYFLGMFGPGGPLPLHLTEHALGRARDFGDQTFARFVDVFHHRLLSLFYRAWASAQPAVNFDRPESDRYADYIGSLFGLGMSSLRDRDEMPDFAKLYFAGRLAMQTRNAEGLVAVLGDFFGFPVRIVPFVGHWIDLPADCVSELGMPSGTLGKSFTLGARVWDCQYKFRIVLGPLAFRDYERLLPGGASLRRLVAIVRNYAGEELSWELQSILMKEQVPLLALGRRGRLGLTTWLISRTPGRDVEGLCIDAARAVARGTSHTSSDPFNTSSAAPEKAGKST